MGDDYLDYLCDVLMPMGDIRKGRLFGLKTLKWRGLQFAMMTDEVLYFAVNEETRNAYIEAGCTPFSYAKADRIVEVHKYYTVPDAILDDEDSLIEWARLAARAAGNPDKQSSKAAAKAKTKAGNKKAR